MKSERRKYRGGEFGVHVGTSVEPSTFFEIEGLMKTFGMNKSEVIRHLLLRGLAEYHRDGNLSMQPGISAGEQTPSYYSSLHK